MKFYLSLLLLRTLMASLTVHSDWMTNYYCTASKMDDSLECQPPAAKWPTSIDT